MIGCGIFSSRNWESLQRLIRSLEATEENCSYYLFVNIPHRIGKETDLNDVFKTAGMEIDAVVNVFRNSKLNNKRVALNLDEYQAIKRVLRFHKVGVFLKDNVVVPRNYFDRIRQELNRGGIVSVKLTPTQRIDEGIAGVNWAVKRKDWHTFLKLENLRVYA